MCRFHDLMKDIRNTVIEMEICEDFSKLQVILNSANKFVRSFDKIAFDSGNEPFIIEIVARLLKYFRIQNYLDSENKVNNEYEKQLRKITMYMLLNTDVSFRYDLTNDSRVNHVLKSLPQLSKCLMLNCIWGLDLDRFLYEMISYAPLWFSMQFLDQAIASLKYAKPYEVLERVESIVLAIYFAIYRTDYDWRKINRNRYVDQQRTLWRIGDFVADLLRYFNTPDVSKFEGWSKLRKHRYFGFLLKHMFSMTSGCLELYSRKPAVPVRPEMRIYELVSDVHVAKEAGQPYSCATEKAFTKINTCLLNSLETCIMQVSIDRFLSWAEFELFKEGEETVTLQQVIGESAYRLSEDLRANRNVQHSIIRHLTQFAMRPKTLAEKASTMTLATLMRKIDIAQSVDERVVYLSEFVSRSECVFGNAECLETVEQHWKLLDGSHVRQMIEYDTCNVGEDDMMDDEDELPEERVKLRELILKTIDTLPAKDFHHLVTFMLDTFGTNFCRYQQPDHEKKLSKLVNCLNEDEHPATWQPNVQQLLFQSPATFYAKLISPLYDGGKRNENYVNSLVAIIARHKTIAQHYMREHLEKLLSGSFDVLRSPLLGQLLLKLYNVALFGQHEFIEQLLLKGISEAYGKQHLQALHELLKLAGGMWLPFIATVAKEKEAARARKQLLLQAALSLADIVGGARYAPGVQPAWKDGDQISLVALAIKLLEETLKHLDKLASNEEKLDLLTKIEAERPRSTQYYFRKHIHCKATESKDNCITVAPEDVGGEEIAEKRRAIEAKPAAAPAAAVRLCPTSFATFMYEDELNSASEDEQILAFLTRVFPQCTPSEAISLARDELLRSYFHQAAIATIRDRLPAIPSTPISCYRNCASNYIQCLLKVLLLPSTAKENPPSEKLSCPADGIRSLLELLQHLPDAAREHIGGDLSAVYRHICDLDLALPELAHKLKGYLDQTATTKQPSEGLCQGDAVERMDIDSSPATIANATANATTNCATAETKNADKQP